MNIEWTFRDADDGTHCARLRQGPPQPAGHHGDEQAIHWWS